MVKVIAGLKGSGKTKRLIDLVTQAAEEEHGNVICLEGGQNLTYNIPYSVRLIQGAEYNFGSFEFIKGFLSGLSAGDYDITHIFVDGLLKMINDDSVNNLEAFLDWCDAFGEKRKIKFTFTISTDLETASAGVKKYF